MKDLPLDARVLGGGDGLVVVLLHGFGAPGTDLVPLAREIPAPQGTRWVLPAAPIALPPEYGSGRAWWMIDVRRLQEAMASGKERDLSREVPEGMAEAHAKVAELLDVLVREHGVRRERIVLGGFSQGAMLSCDVALRTSEPLAGLALMSGTLLAEDEWTPLMPRRAGLRVMQSHGKSDPLLPFGVAERLRDALTKAGLDVTWTPFQGGHEIPMPVVRAFGDLLHACARDAGCS